MPTIEERVAALEGWKESLSLDIQDLKDRMLRLEQRIDHIDRKIDSVRDELHTEINLLRTELTKRMDIQFRWLVGFQFAVLLSIVALLMRMLFG